jgi:quinol-cytochrome oxidoreductase complex cytochrome b subunit
VNITRSTVKFVDERSGAAPFLKKGLRYVFPDHWSFLLGEVALYAFIVLVGTGVYLTLFFEPSTADTVYHGSYGPLHGAHMTQAYRSVVDISFKVKAGLLIRQTHHWAANVFIAAIVLHLFRIFFTGAFRKPRDLTYFIGLAMLTVALLEGYLGSLSRTTSSPGWGSRSGTPSQCRSPSSARTSQGSSGAGRSPAAMRSGRGCTSRTSSCSRR